MNLLKKLMKILTLIDICPKCGGEMVLDQERFDAGYSARSICLKCKGEK